MPPEANPLSDQVPDFDDDPFMFCECGVTLMGYPDEGDGLCATCNASPHGRECVCDECEAYWADIARRSAEAAEEYNRRLSAPREGQPEDQ